MTVLNTVPGIGQDPDHRFRHIGKDEFRGIGGPNRAHLTLEQLHPGDPLKSRDLL